MKATKVSVPALPAPVDPFNLCFNDFKYAKGAYQHRNGKVFVVHSEKGSLVSADGVRTGKTRTNMFCLEKDGVIRAVCCGDGPDGDKNWRKLASGTVSVTI